MNRGSISTYKFPSNFVSFSLLTSHASTLTSHLLLLHSPLETSTSSYPRLTTMFSSLRSTSGSRPTPGNQPTAEAYPTTTGTSSNTTQPAPAEVPAGTAGSGAAKPPSSIPTLSPFIAVLTNTIRLVRKTEDPPWEVCHQGQRRCCSASGCGRWASQLRYIPILPIVIVVYADDTSLSREPRSGCSHWTNYFRYFRFSPAW